MMMAPRNDEFLLCTTCGHIVSSNVALNGIAYSHPILEVLVCKKCYDRLSETNFSTNKICKWCGFRGKFVMCKKCSSTFCMGCLKNNFDEQMCINIQKKKNWICFICEPKPLALLKKLCALKACNLKKNTNVCSPISRKRAISESCSKPAKRHQRSKSCDDVSDNTLSQLCNSQMKDEKIPNQDDITNIKKELLAKAKEMLTLVFEVNQSATEFNKKFENQSYNLKVLQNAFTFQYDLIDTLSSTLEIWKKELKVHETKWLDDFAISLILPKQPASVDLNNKDTNTENDSANIQSKKDKRLRLSLNRTYESDNTDDGLLSNVNATLVAPQINLTPNGELGSKESTINQSLLELPSVPTNTDDQEDNESIFSVVTNMHDDLNSSRDIDVDDNNLPKVATLCEKTGHFQDDAIIHPDDDKQSEVHSDCLSDHSFIFDLGNCTNLSSPTGGTIDEENSEVEKRELTEIEVEVNDNGDGNVPVPNVSNPDAEELDAEEKSEHGIDTAIEKTDLDDEEMKIKLEFMRMLDLGSQTSSHIKEEENDVNKAIDMLLKDDFHFSDTDYSSLLSGTDNDDDIDIEDDSDTGKTSVASLEHYGSVHDIGTVLLEDSSNLDDMADADKDISKTDPSVEYQIKDCNVILEKCPTDLETINNTSKTRNINPEDKELNALERLINLDNLDMKVTNKNENDESRKKKKLRRRKVKPSSSLDSVTESETDDCDFTTGTILNWEASPNSLSYSPTDDIKTPQSILHAMRDIDSNTDSDSNFSEDDEGDFAKKNKAKRKRSSSIDSEKEEEPEKAEITTNEKELNDEEKAAAEKKKWRNDPLLKERICESDSDVESDLDSDGIIEGDNILSEKTKKKMEKLDERMTNRDTSTKEKKSTFNTHKNNSESESDIDSVLSLDFGNKVDNKRNEIVINTDTDSDIEFVSEEKKKGTKKNLRSKRSISVSSDENSNAKDEDDSENKKKGRKNIRAIISYDTLEEATKLANLLERQRKTRLSQKHLSMDKILSQSQSQTETGMILDIDKDTKEPTIVVHSTLTNSLKPHQREGVRFMWESCYESISQVKKNAGSGCILAHCMGLGKTRQVITLIHTLFKYPETKTKYVMVICPLSIVLNWKNEFINALQDLTDNVQINLHCISTDSAATRRLFIVDKWQKETGVLVLGYEAYVRLITINNMEKLTLQEENIQKALVNPGADLVVLDEGHLLKNGKNLRTRSLMKMKTKRRIILTGTPLQNNLAEYYFMVQFVKPNLLGSFQEYTNRFVNPIINGQYHDSTQQDIHYMKTRSLVLNKMLSATIQRYEVTELRTYLPEKYDYVLFIHMHPLQATLYQAYLDILKQEGYTYKTMLGHFHKLHVIWTHPLLLFLRREMRVNVPAIDHLRAKGNFERLVNIYVKT